MTAIILIAAVQGAVTLVLGALLVVASERGRR